METVATALDWLGSAAFRWSAIGFFLMNGIAVAAFFLTKDRGLVNRWTSKLVVGNVLLIGTGIGVPVLTKAATLVVQAVAATTGQPVAVRRAH
jgi:hypothetical protein